MRAQIYLAGLIAFFVLDFVFYHAQIGQHMLVVLGVVGRFAGRFATAII